VQVIQLQCFVQPLPPLPTQILQPGIKLLNLGLSQADLLAQGASLIDELAATGSQFPNCAGKLVNLLLQSFVPFDLVLGAEFVFSAKSI
jgi:hypothetical protein